MEVWKFRGVVYGIAVGDYQFPQSVACEARHAPSGPSGRTCALRARTARPASPFFVSFVLVVIYKYTGSPSLCSSVHPSVTLCDLKTH